MENKIKKQEAIKITEVKEEKPKKEESKTKIPSITILTLKERIEKVVDESLVNSQIDDLVVPKEVRVTLEKKIFALIQRYLHPEQFCPNCEYKAIVTTSSKNTPTIERKGVIPPQVEKMIQQSDENMKDVPIPKSKTALGIKIRKLVADRDRGGGGEPTKEDESKIKGQDKNVSNQINWS